jgi:hypothetical protein
MGRSRPDKTLYRSKGRSDCTDDLVSEKLPKTIVNEFCNLLFRGCHYLVCVVGHLLHLHVVICSVSDRGHRWMSHPVTRQWMSTPIDVLLDATSIGDKHTHIHTHTHTQFQYMTVCCFRRFIVIDVFASGKT